MPPRPRSAAVRRPAGLAALAALGAVGAAAACGRDAAPECLLVSECRVPPKNYNRLAVGDLVRLNARTDAACDTATAEFRTGRVMVVSERAIVVADTGNPAGGFSEAEYAGVAAAFDTLVYPVDVRHFGEPTDLDGNGRAIIFYTRAVNALTPPNAGFVIGGFFWNRDLFPRTGADACPGSNDGELFYMLAPDPAGTINGNRRSKDSVLSSTVSVIAHEFQHLINASRRLYVAKTANYDEVTWLNEGMSHVAEELSFYQAAGLSPAGQPGQSPRARLTTAALRARPGALVALNAFNAQNLARFGRYLRAAADSSPYANNDALATRGAAWAFLRYAADRAGRPDSVFLRRLVSNSQLGYDNLAAATGAGAALPDWFRDWAVANYADGLTAGEPDARFAYASWQFRQVLPSVSANTGQYPLATTPLATGRAAASLVGGGTAYFPFRVPAGGTAVVRTRTAAGAAPPAAVRTALVRLTAGTGDAVTAFGPADGADVTVTNPAAGAAQYALVVFNGGRDATAREAVVVTATGLVPLASVASASAASAAGPAAARLTPERPAGAAAAGAPADDAAPPVTDAPLHARLRAIGQRELAWRVPAARAAFAARRGGAARQ